MSGMVSFQPGWQVVQHVVGRGLIVLTLFGGVLFVSNTYAQTTTTSATAQTTATSATAQTTATSATAQTTAAGVNGQQVITEKTWAFNFKETEIEELVRYVAQSLDKTIIIDPKVKGKVKVMAAKSVNAEEMYDLFLSILEVHGFAAVDSGGVTRIIPSKSARTSPVPVTSGQVNRAGSSIITQVIQLENISAAKLIPVLRPLAPQQAHMAAYAPSNAIIISDTAANIKRIKSVIQKIDLSAVQKTEVVPLEHASSEEVVRMLDQLSKNEAAKGKAETKKVVIVADKRTNSVLIGGDELERQRIKTLIRNIDTPLAQSGNVRVTYLKYAKATDLSEVLTKVVQNMERMSAGNDKSKSASKSTSTIEADEGTNSLIITAEADAMQSLSGVIERLDIRRAQVLVEAIIVELQSNGTDTLGVEWLFVNEGGGYGSSTGAGANNAIVQAVVGAANSTIPNAATAAIANSISNPANPGQLFGVGKVDGSDSFNVVINALKTQTDSNILSTPKLLTLDNEEASITVGQNISFVSGSYTATGTGGSTPQSPFQTQEQRNVGITLKITPHINEGDSLILEIEQDVSSVLPGQSVNSNPVTSERNITTKVLANDGQTIVLGGLIDNKTSDVYQKVPLLGDIPILGALFRSRTSTPTKQHLLVFLRPTIIREEKTMDLVTAEKYKFIRNEQIQEYGLDREGADLQNDPTLLLLPEWEEQLKDLRDIRDQQQEQPEQETQEKTQEETQQPQGAQEASTGGGAQ